MTVKSHFNQSVLLEQRQGIDHTMLEPSLKKLVAHHDALRMTYGESGG